MLPESALGERDRVQVLAVLAQRGQWYEWVNGTGLPKPVRCEQVEGQMYGVNVFWYIPWIHDTINENWD